MSNNYSASFILIYQQNFPLILIYFIKWQSDLHIGKNLNINSKKYYFFGYQKKVELFTSVVVLGTVCRRAFAFSSQNTAPQITDVQKSVLKKYAVSNSKSNGPLARLRRRFSRGGDQSDAPTVMWPA
ncbi:hypothetical protein T06_14464 [Trichinella sp. T6]|nr:hypothetical protein T06_14464 [Trichinella sp. T6]